MSSSAGGHRRPAAVVIQRRRYDPREEIIRSTNYSPQEGDGGGDTPTDWQEQQEPRWENCLMLFSCRAAMRRMLFLQIHLKRVGRDFLDGLDVPGDPAGAGSFLAVERSG